MSIRSLNGTAGGVIPQPPPIAGSDAPAASLVPTPTPTQPRPAASPPSNQQVQDAVKQMEQAVQAKASALQFSVDDSSGKTVVRVVDQHTGDVIRQIPSEEVLKIAQSIEQFQGLLAKVKA